MEPFVGQIMQVGFDFAPRGWAKCWNQTIAIQQQTALFSLIGTTFGGNGQTTFNLPDTRGRMSVGTGQLPGGSTYQIGQIAGTENTTLSLNQMPMHNHTAAFTPSGSSLSGSVQAMSGVPYGQQTDTPAAGSFLGSVSEIDTAPHLYVPAGTSGTAVNLGGVAVTGNVTGSVTVAINGGSQPFSILSPYLALNTIIAIEGVFPSRN